MSCLNNTHHELSIKIEKLCRRCTSGVSIGLAFIASDLRQLERIIACTELLQQPRIMHRGCKMDAMEAIPTGSTSLHYLQVLLPVRWSCPDCEIGYLRSWAWRWTIMTASTNHSRLYLPHEQFFARIRLYCISHFKLMLLLEPVTHASFYPHAFSKCVGDDVVIFLSTTHNSSGRTPSE